MDGLRKGLAESIEAHKVASARVESAAQVVDKAKAYVRQLEAESTSFEGVEHAVASSRAEAIKASMTTGGAPSFAMSPELQRAVARRAETGTTLSAARQAAAALAGEHSEAVAVEREAKTRVESCAGAVVVSEIEDLSSEIRTLEDRATTLRAKLHAASRVWGAFHVTRAARVKLGAQAVHVLCAKSPREEIEALNSPAQKLSVAQSERWQSYLRELTSDADVAFD